MSSNIKVLTFTLILSFTGPSYAGVYSDDLARCLVESSTPSHKSALVKWMFTAMALHPDVASMASISAQQRYEVNKAASEMFVTLMTDKCLSQAKKAIQYEGVLAIQQGFNVFGQVAGQELFNNPNVAQGLADLEQHMDSEKLATLLGLPN